MIVPNNIVSVEINKISLQHKTFSIGVLVGLANMVGGLAIMLVPESLKVTAMYALAIINNFLGITIFQTGLGLFITGAMAVLGDVYLSYITFRWKMITLIPQQILMMLKLMAISMVIMHGAYPDGYVPKGGSWFILTDQIWTLILAIAHTLWFFSLVVERRVSK